MAYKNNMNHTSSTTRPASILWLLVFTISLLVRPMFANAAIEHQGDPHYNEVGFFDMHVCNWPNKPLFFLSLFSTTRFNEISRIEIYDNNKRFIGRLDLTKYRTVMLKKPAREKRVFMRNLEIPKTSGNGWYTSKVFLRDGHVVSARDYVIIYKMERATGMRPAPDVTLDDVPKSLSWKPVPGARYYQVFIKDMWIQNTVYSSDLLTTPEIQLPKDLLIRGGYYCWRIHARDTNENILLGDFNHGSLTDCFIFDIKG